MSQQVDKKSEGLRVLARMVAASYKRQLSEAKTMPMAPSKRRHLLAEESLLSRATNVTLLEEEKWPHR